MSHPLSGPVLTLDAALDGSGAGLVLPGGVVRERRQAGHRGAAAALPALAASLLAETSLAVRELAAIAVTVGPGSFTGIRAALALAQGMALGAGVPVLGTAVGGAIRAGLMRAGGAAAWSGPVWVAIDSRRGRVFLDRDGPEASRPLAALPAPPPGLALAGDAAEAVAAEFLRAHGVAIPVLGPAWPGPAGIALGAVEARLPALPLYLDPPEARPAPIRPGLLPPDQTAPPPG